MNRAKAARQVDIIVDYAIEFLAQKHSTTNEAVTAAIEAGNEKLADQFKELVSAGMATALAM